MDLNRLILSHTRQAGINEIRPQVIVITITCFDFFANPIAKIKRTCYNDANGNAQFPIDKEVRL